MHYKKSFSIFIFLLTSLISNKIFAQEVSKLSQHGQWTAYSYTDDSGPVCYMVSEPRSARGKYTRRGDIFALVTHRPKDNATDVVSIVAGYPYKDNSDVNIRIGSNIFSLFTHGERAWNRDEESDKKMVRAMIKGTTMEVKGTSSRGTLTTDSYSLNGFTAAHRTITKKCSS